MRQVQVIADNEPLQVVSDHDPHPGRGEVCVRLRAAALNHRDVWITKGLYPGVRHPCTPGSDGAGSVIALGEGVDPAWMHEQVLINPGFDWGPDEHAQQQDFTILGLPRPGTHATHVCVPAEQLAPMPAHLDAVQAAALPLAGLTAYRALFVQGHCREDQTVLISGIGGGVALFAFQFAQAAGARVVVTSSDAGKRERALALGAADAFDYQDPEWTQRLREEFGGVDVVIDGAAGPRVNEHIAVANPGGRIVIYGGTAGLPEQVNIRPLFWKQLRIQGSTMGSAADFAAMTSFVTEHNIVPVVDSVIPLEEAQRAYDAMDGGRQFGKLVLDCSDD